MKNDSSYWSSYTGCNCFGKLEYNINNNCICHFGYKKIVEILNTINKYLIIDQIFPTVFKLLDLDQKEDCIDFIEASEIIWNNDLFNYLKSLNI